MKKNLRTGIFFAVFFAIGIFWCGREVPAASFQTLGSYVKESRTYSVDMTGDGKNDTVKITFGKDQYQIINRVKVYINQKLALNLGTSRIYGVNIQYLHLSKNQEYLYLCGRGDSGMPDIQALYRYESSKKALVKALSLRSTAGSIDKVTANSIRVVNSCQPSLTGRVTWKDTYTYKNGKFRLKSNTAKASSLIGGIRTGDGYEKYLEKNQFVTQRAVTFYTDKTMTKQAFTVTANKAVTLRQISVTANRQICFQFKSGNKTGWIREQATCFYGVSSRCAGGFYG